MPRRPSRADGYRQAKWVAEGVIGIARSRGIPVSVYRVDVVSGDQVNGACQTQDFEWLSIRRMITAGAVPAGISGYFHPTPVDYVSAAILRLSFRLTGVEDTYNLSNPHRLHFSEVVDQFRALGHTLVDRDGAEWSRTVRSDPENSLLPLLDVFEAAVSGIGDYPGMGTHKTEAALAGSGISCPQVTGELLARYLKFFTDQGYFPASRLSRAFGRRPRTQRCFRSGVQLPGAQSGGTVLGGRDAAAALEGDAEREGVGVSDLAGDGTHRGVGVAEQVGG